MVVVNWNSSTFCTGNVIAVQSGIPGRHKTSGYFLVTENMAIFR